MRLRPAVVEPSRHCREILSHVGEPNRTPVLVTREMGLEPLHSFFCSNRHLPLAPSSLLSFSLPYHDPSAEHSFSPSFQFRLHIRPSTSHDTQSNLFHHKPALSNLNFNQNRGAGRPRPRPYPSQARADLQFHRTCPLCCLRRSPAFTSASVQCTRSFPHRSLNISSLLRIRRHIPPPLQMAHQFLTRCNVRLTTSPLLGLLIPFSSSSHFLPTLPLGGQIYPPITQNPTITSITLIPSATE